MCLFFYWSVATGQQNQDDLITAEFKGILFEKVLEQIESSTRWYFYFDREDIKGLLINRSFDRAPLGDVLDQTLEGTDLKFSIDKVSKRVFITSGQQIQTDLPDGFFRKGSDVVVVKEERFIVDPFEENIRLPGKREDQLYEVGTKTRTIKAGTVQLFGQVRNRQTGEPVYGASLYIENPFIGASTDQFGNYTLSIPTGSHTLKVNSVGMVAEELRLIVYSSGRFDIDISENVVSLKEVEVNAGRDRNITQAQMGLERISMKTIRQVPMVMGEPDVLRVLLTLPGVKTVGEASTGFNVRGGAVDQNLILYNNATIYNPSHLFGFFSAFNPDVVDGVELYKSSIPSKYGGRLSSVLEVKPRYGNKKTFEGKAGIGLLTSSLSVEGPLGSGKTSYLAGVRGTYSNWVLNLLENANYRNSKGSFYDVNLNLTHELSEKSNLYFTSYISDDQFQLRSDTLFNYTNKNASLRWKYIFNDKLNSDFSAGISEYKYNISSEENPVNAFNLSFNIRQVNLQGDFNYSLHPKHTLNFGISSVNYKLHPGSFQPLGESSAIVTDVLEPEMGIESALYLEDQFEVSDKLSLNLGLRYSMYNYLGAKNVISYAPGLPRQEANILDTASYNAGEFIRSYHGPEYRLSLRYLISDDFSVKAGYNTLRQYIHMLSNTTAISPTDIWKLSDPNIRPQSGEQFSLGFYKNIRSGVIETSVEGYYKNIKDYLDYKGGAELVMNHAIETDVVNTEGKAYGAEFLIKKLRGKMNGWMSYTYSRTLLRLNDPVAGETINNGNWYPANFDKPHDFTFIGNYKFSHRFSISLNTTYSTGRPVTLPVAKYIYAGSERVYYSDRNAYRIPDYFRMDLSMNIEGNHKLKQLTHNFWTIGVYNLTARRNVYSTYFISERKTINGYKLSVFGTAIPFINYNIRF